MFGVIICWGDVVAMKTYFYKVVLLGNSEVGKTTLFRKLIEKPAGTASRDFVESIELGPCNLEFTLTRSVKVQVMQCALANSTSRVYYPGLSV